MLGRLLFNDAKMELDARGLTPDNIGTHSLRKGSASYTTSGSTSCPSTVAVHLRAGWNMGGVTDRYLRYEGAGDMYVGRTVCGLPITHAEFAILPPHFKIRNELTIETIKECFPGLPSNMTLVAEFSVASVVYHSDYLFNKLPKNHLLFSTSLFSNWTRLQTLKQAVQCHLPRANDPFKPTGVPPHILQLNKLKEISDNIGLIIPAIEQSTTNAINGLIQVLEDRAIGSGTVTYDGLTETINTTMKNVLESTGVLALLAANQTANTAVAQDLNPNPVAVQSELFYWNGRYRQIPEDFEFPKGGVAIIFQAWFFPNERLKYPSLKRLQLVDFDVNTSKRKRLSGLQKLIKIIQDKLIATDHWIANPTVLQVIIFNVDKSNVQ